MAENPMWNRPDGASPAGAPSDAKVGQRTIAEVTAILKNMEYAVQAKGYELPEFYEGAQAAYQWVLGQSPAPFTGRTGVPDRDQLRAEDDAADEAMRLGARRTFANGVQHAVMWVRGETQDQPWLMWN